MADTSPSPLPREARPWVFGGAAVEVAGVAAAFGPSYVANDGAIAFEMPWIAVGGAIFVAGMLAALYGLLLAVRARHPTS